MLIVFVAIGTFAFGGLVLGFGGLLYITFSLVPSPD